MGDWLNIFECGFLLSLSFNNDYRSKRTKLEAEFAKFGDPASNYYDAQEAARIEAEISALDEQFTQLQQRAKEAIDAAVEQFRDNVPLF